MHETEIIEARRRKFLVSSPLLLLGAASFQALPSTSEVLPKGPDLRESLSAEEMASVHKSTMAVDMDNYWHKGYSCAETGLMVALRFMKKPEDLVWAAGGFGGGMGKQDLCGFLTAGIMAIGLHTGSLRVETKIAKALCGQKTNEFWSWWTSTAPLRCREIREGHKDFNVCQRLGKLACAKLEDLFKA